MTVKKLKTKKTKKTKSIGKSKKQTKTKSKKKKNDLDSDSGIVVIEDDLTIDKDAVNEERRAYLEEARSQEASD